MLDGHGEAFKQISLPAEAMRVLEEMLDEFKSTFGREPRDDDLVFPHLYMYSEQELERQTIGAMHQAGVRPELIYAYRKTQRIVSENNKDLLSPIEMKEWEDAIDEYFELEPRTDEYDQLSLSMTELLSEWDSLLVLLGTVITKVYKQNHTASKDECVSRINLTLYLCTIRTYRSLKSILLLLQQDAGEDVLSLCRTMFDNYLAMNYVIAEPSRAYELVDRALGLAAGTFLPKNKEWRYRSIPHRGDRYRQGVS